MRAEPLMSQHRQKPWVSTTKIFEVEGSISRADGELTNPVDLVSSRFTGFKREMPKIQVSWMAFFGGKGTKKKKGETTWRVRGSSLVRCNLNEPESWSF